MNYCAYFQARITRERCWMFTAIIRSYEHLAFDRTLDAKTSTFEFFVPHGHVVPFRKLMQRLETEGLVADLIELPNRFSTDS